jgi:hypothetical protein
MAFTVRATAIVPKGFKVPKIQREVQIALDKEGKNDKKEFDKTINWSGEKPKMAYETKITSKEASVWIGPKGAETAIEKWRRLDEGSPAHDISARRAPTLVFPWQGKGRSYNPKTRPTWMGSNRGAGQKFGPIRRPKLVNHPGNEPRYWSRTLAAQRIGPFAQAVQEAINKGMA